VALVVLAVAGTALIVLLGQTSQTMRATRDTERETVAASRVLDRFAAMDRATLRASIGRRDVAGFSAQITELPGDLLEILVARSDTSPVLLRTILYRPDSTRDDTL